MEVYLDNSATTRCFDEVADYVAKIMMLDYGNPSSMHLKGVEAERYIRYAKDTLSRILKVNEKEIVFTSGGTESDNLALIGTAMAYVRRGKHLITTKIEHPAILQTMQYLEGQGFEVTYLDVNEVGQVRIEDLQRALRPDTILVSVMHTNNEIGSLMPLQEIGEVVKSYHPNIVFHVDGVQGFGKAVIHPKKLKIDLLSVSAHKIHGPKGVGFLYINEKVRVLPILFGGGQQKGMRSGTENVPGIAGMAMAADKMYANLEEDCNRMRHLKQLFIDGISDIPEVYVNGKTDEDSAPHIVSVSVAGVRSEVLLHALEEKGIYVSAGSACASNKPQTSATLLAIGVKKYLLDATIRFSFSVFTNEEEISYTVKALHELIPLLRRYTRH
ncbi:MAG: cysteine desulfurase family protein [Lachnospiraceae bacterium]|nr:cysteine desulfurase family protein [Lachnospiraceae bacterium]